MHRLNSLKFMTVFFISADAGEVDKESTKLDLAGMMTSQEVEGTSSKDQLKPSSSKTNLKKTGKLPEFVLHRTPPPYTNVTVYINPFFYYDTFRCLH